MANRNLVNKDRPSFKQQNLPAWQPILTAGTVLPTFFLIGVTFVPIGFGLLMSSLSVQEFTLDYTDCRSIKDISKTCESIVALNASRSCECLLEFELPEDFRREVYVYYGLSNFYQNHRRYVKSRDDRQLLGDLSSKSSDCEPYLSPVAEKTLTYAPCGAVANSKFNDTFDLVWRKDNYTTSQIILQKIGIAWPSDKKIRFRNPEGFAKDPAQAFYGTIKPKNWDKRVFELAPKYPENNGFQNEDLIVWMRTAALPTFRKLYGIVTKTGELEKDDINHLPRGKYFLRVDYHFPVHMFNGRKRFIISNTSWLGGKNNFLAVAYIVVGCICFLLSAVFLFIHKKYGRLPSEVVQINQNTPYLSQ